MKLFKKFKKEEKRARLSSAFWQEMKKKKEDGTLIEVWEDWKWILRYTKKYRGAVVFYTLTGIFSATFSLVSAVASKYTIDIITGFQFSRVWLLAAIMVGSALISITFNALTSRISTKLSIDINNDIQQEVFDHLARADWLQLSQFSHGDLLNRFNSDAAAVANNAINWIPSVIISVYQFVATFCVIWFYSPIMALIALSSAPLLLLSSKTLLRIQRRYLKKVRKASSKLMAFEVESFYNLDTIKSFGLSGQYSGKLKDKLKSFRNLNLDYNRYTILTNVFLSLISSLVEFAAFGYCLFQLWTRQITYGTMTLFLQQRSSLSSSFNKLVSIIPNILTASVSCARIRELLDIPCEPETEEDLPAFERGVEVRMEDADFAYTDGHNVITNSSFKASPGEIVALIGPSGEGKTTMIRLFLGLVQPHQGEVVLVDGTNNTRLTADAATRKVFSYVPQGNTILSGTIAENLRLVKEDASDEELQKALKQACAWDFVSRMENGLNSKVGEKGKGLSEGQGQRIAIARAILRDAPVLLLDEATSALDVTTERRVLQNIIQSRPDKTVIVTTHRPSVLNLCDRVYRVIEEQVTELDEEASSRMAMDF